MPRWQLKPNPAITGRLVAEFFVIVIGVLVALAVDAALEAREERRQEHAYYEALALDLAADIEEYRFSLRMLDRSLASAHHVRAIIRGEPVSVDQALSASLEFASWVNYPSWNSGTLDELFSAGTIRLLRNPAIKEAIHSYRSMVSEWRPRVMGEEFSAFLDYRVQTTGLIPLEARMAYWNSSLNDPDIPRPAVDEATLAARLTGDQELLTVLERMMLEWDAIRGITEGSLAAASEVQKSLEALTTTPP